MDVLGAVVGRRATTAAPSPAALLDAGADRLAGWGLTPAECRRVLASAELARRFQPAPEACQPVTSARLAVPHLRALRRAQREILVALLLDSRMQPIRVATVASGGRMQVSAAPRDVVAAALTGGAGALVLAHNHPSGAAQPSPEDIAFTRLTAAAAEVVGIEVVDHIVVARRAFTSLREAGLWP